MAENEGVVMKEVVVRHSFAVAIVVVLLSTNGDASSSQGTAPFRIASASPEQYAIEYVPSAFPLSSVDIDGRKYLLYAGATDQARALPGMPLLPVEAFGLGIPFGTVPDVQLVDAVYATDEDQLIAPAPSYKFTEEQEAIPQYTIDRVAYSRSAFFPETQVSVEEPATIRYQRIATVRISPYQYNPASRTLRRLVRATLSVHLKPDGRPGDLSLRPSPSDPFFEDAYRGLMLNYEQARVWRMAKTQPGPPDSTRDWFETGRTYYRLLVPEDGWYRVTKAQLVAAGAVPSMIDPPTMKVFGRGIQVPIVVRPDTSVEFYALRNYGDSTYLDFFTDTSTYWLTWGGTAGQRFTPALQHPAPPGTSVQSVVASRHFEQNTQYWYGVTQDDNINNEVVPGEGWLWMFIYVVPFPTEVPFSIDNLDTSSGTATIRVRLFSTTLNLANPDHHLRFWLNDQDTPIGEVMFNGRTGVTFTAAVPTSYLVPGTNRLKILSLQTQTPANGVYLDWFEADYGRFLKAQNDQLFFATQSGFGGSPAQFTVSGFSNASIEVYDLSNARRITGGTISGDSTAGFTVVFKDTATSARKYLVLAANGQRLIPSVEQKMFSDIRVNAQGADYIIISHKKFIAAAQRLAQHRQMTNNVRARVIDVQEIYDEFNYGVLNATKLKTFLRHAYLNWPAPAPSNVLLFGDASWDFHKYLATSTKTNYVPGYGIPTGDNWFGCFDTAVTFIPSLKIGRLPVQDSVQAQQVVDKLMGYDQYALAEWNKSFMMITGGQSQSEQNTFRILSDNLISNFIQPAPIGGTAIRVYKASSAVIDGEYKRYMQERVQDGLGFINFIGHSGGRVWNVDIGNPNDLQNTNGRLPFVSSVSCNVGAFAEPSNNVLAEEFVLAENRGAIAAWASSSLGFAQQGTRLVYHWLTLATADTMREFGALTTSARYRYWQEAGSTFQTRAILSLNPLLGDPLSRLAIPRKPDLAVSADDFEFSLNNPSPVDSSVAVKLKLHNFGLVPADSIGFRFEDVYGGRTLPLVSRRIGRIFHVDSLAIPWTVSSKVGPHTLVAKLDPDNLIQEVTKLNNVASKDQYVYANVLSVVKPIDNMVVPAGTQTLVVSSPVGYDSVGFHYEFQLDTVATFDSPYLMSSGAIAAGPVSGQWTTPSVPNNQLFFWRARTVDGSLVGNWVLASFATSSDIPAPPLVRWREKSPKQFGREIRSGTAATDSGVTLAPSVPINLFVRSLGYRANPNQDYYSIIKINDQTIFGLWFLGAGNSFMALRLNEFNGTFVFKPFDVVITPSQADSMKQFIQETPVGNYIAFSVIFDGRTNVTESLYVAIESLGSTLIRQVQPGQSWAFIGRKGAGGPGMPALESLTNDSAVVSLQVPNYYRVGAGSLTATGFSIPVSWDSFHWRTRSSPGATTIRSALLGIQGNGTIDTLRLVPSDSGDISLSFLNPVTAGPTYKRFRPSALLNTTDAVQSPSLTEWWVDFVPPPDLAISSRTITLQHSGGFVLPVTVHNIGYRGIDSARIAVSLYDRLNMARPIAFGGVDTIPVNGSKSTTIPVNMTFTRNTLLQVDVSPTPTGKDLVAENNTAYYFVRVIGSATRPVRILADGKPLMDGDYVSSRPRISFQVTDGGEQQTVAHEAQLLVNNAPVVQSGALSPLTQSRSAGSLHQASFVPELSSGSHELKVRLLRVNALGERDTLEQSVLVNVDDRLRILRVYNFPNPFARETYFTFELTGSRAPDEVLIRVFTVSGRRVRDIHVPVSDLQVGLYRVYWDGRDEDGDEVANGYYFYKVVVRGDHKVESSTEKLARVR
jgi:hypothetical protein